MASEQLVVAIATAWHVHVRGTSPELAARIVAIDLGHPDDYAAWNEVAEAAIREGL